MYFSADPVGRQVGISPDVGVTSINNTDGKLLRGGFPAHKKEREMLRLDSRAPNVI